jgi:hypothetical protein
MIRNVLNTEISLAGVVFMSQEENQPQGRERGAKVVFSFFHCTDKTAERIRKHHPE